MPKLTQVRSHGNRLHDIIIECVISGDAQKYIQTDTENTKTSVVVKNGEQHGPGNEAISIIADSQYYVSNHMYIHLTSTSMTVIILTHENFSFPTQMTGSPSLEIQPSLVSGSSPFALTWCSCCSTTFSSERLV